MEPSAAFSRLLPVAASVGCRRWRPLSEGKPGGPHPLGPGGCAAESPDLVSSSQHLYGASRQIQRIVAFQLKTDLLAAN